MQPPLSFQSLLPCHCLQELPPWFLERQNISRRYPGLKGRLCFLVKSFSSDLMMAFHSLAARQLCIPLPKLFIDGVGFTDRSLAGVDLLSLDGCRAVRCSNSTLPHAEVKRFLRLARWVYKAPLAYLMGGVSAIAFVCICFYLCAWLASTCA